MRTIVKIILVLVALCAKPVWSQNVLVGMDATWPPMEFLDDSRQIVGFDVDFMKAIAKEASFDVVFQNVGWGDLFAGLRAGKYDVVCSALTITDERQKLMDFSLPYFWDRKIRQSLIVRGDSAVKELSGMKGMTVGVQDDTTGHAAVRRVEGVIAKPYRSIGQALDDLSKGLIDGVVCDDPVATNYLLEHKDAVARIKVAGFVESGDEYYGIAVKKGRKDLLDLINKGIESVQAKGIDRDLRVKWMGK